MQGPAGDAADPLGRFVAVLREIGAEDARCDIPGDTEPDIQFASLRAEGAVFVGKIQTFEIQPMILEGAVFELLRVAERLQYSMCEDRPGR